MQCVVADSYAWPKMLTLQCITCVAVYVTQLGKRMTQWGSPQAVKQLNRATSKPQL
jgi:hypothetical protein